MSSLFVGWVAGERVFMMFLYFFHLKKSQVSLEVRQPEVEICYVWIWCLRISLHIR